MAEVDTHPEEIERLRIALRKAEGELQQVREAAEAQRHVVDIMNEVMGNLSTDEIFHMLARRLARALDLSHSSVILARVGDRTGLVATAFEQPQLQDLEIDLSRYPEVTAALEKQKTLLIPDIMICGRYAGLRELWAREGTVITVRSILALPFTLDHSRTGVFLLRRTADKPVFAEADAEFAATVIRSAMVAMQKAHTIEITRADNARLEVLAHTDPLTHLLNRRALTARLSAELERVRRYNAPLALLMVDIDHFKLVNDTFGHLAGDDVLQEVATILQRAARSVDMVARYGGEEFVIVLPETGPNGAVAFAERLREKVYSTQFSLSRANKGHLTVSVGVANYPAPGIDSPEDLFRAADAALYRAKEAGRNLVCA